MTKTAVVTGGSRGIGLAVCARLADEGYRVVAVSRTPGNATHVVADLARQADVRELAERLDFPVDLLVHNAAVWPSRRRLTEDGVEESFAINHLAPFLLNHLLEDRLTRVVQVSAGLHVKGRAEPGRTSVGADFSSMRTHADTKLCNLLTVPLFARRWADRGITIDAVHPGVIRTGLGDRSGPMGLLLRFVKRRFATPEEGADPVVRLARASGTGRYFHLAEEAPQDLDLELAARIWAEAEALTSLG